MSWRVLCLVLLVVTAIPALAAEVTRRPDGTVFLSGPIVAGDLARLRAIRAEPHSTVSLKSKGGSFQEGMAIARWFYQTKMRTVIEDANECLSACAIAFLGGSAQGEEGMDLPGRSLSPRARLGFHAPFLNLGPGRFTEAHVQTYYDRAVRTIVDVVSNARYLHVEHGDAAELMRPQRTELLYLDTAQLAGRYNITVQGLKMPPHLTQTMALSLCANGWDWAHNSRLTDVTATEDPDVFSEAQTLVRETRWTARDAMARDSYDRTLLFVPLTPAILYQTIYCVLEVGDPDSGTYTSCRGFYMDESLESLKGYVLNNPAEVSYPCRVDFVVDPFGAYDPTTVARALVPPTTPISEMQAVLARLLSDEEPLRPK